MLCMLALIFLKTENGSNDFEPFLFLEVDIFLEIETAPLACLFVMQIMIPKYIQHKNFFMYMLRFKLVSNKHFSKQFNKSKCGLLIFQINYSKNEVNQIDKRSDD